MTHAAAIQYLDQMKIALELLGEDPALARSYDQAAAIARQGDARTWDAFLSGAGPVPAGLAPDLQRSLMAVARGAGRVELEALHMRVPPGLFQILTLPALDAGRVRTLWRDLGVISLRQLARACRRGRLSRLEGFGPALEKQILAQIVRLHHGGGRWLRSAAEDLVESTQLRLRHVRDIADVAVAGDLRRAMETVDTITWVISSARPRATLGRLANQEGARIEEEAAQDTVVFTAANTPDQRLVVVSPEHFAVRLFLETGHPAHTQAVLARLAARGVRPDQLPPSEEEIYRLAGLPLIDPVLREDRGEIEAAEAGALPRLIRGEDLHGILHMHTSWSDGRASLRHMIRAGVELGWEYVGVADHSQAAFYAGGLTPERLRKQALKVEELRPEFPSLHIFHGVECDILPSGQLDLPDDLLAELDFVIVSIHSMMRMGTVEMTDRIIAALEHPATTLLAHPSGRLLLEREAYGVEWDRVFDTAARHGVAIEFNAPPERLDLDWRLIRAATSRGIPICINPDAHSPEAMGNVFASIATARKGWLTPEQVLNTKSAGDMAAHLRARQERARAQLEA